MLVRESHKAEDAAERIAQLSHSEKRRNPDVGYKRIFLSQKHIEMSRVFTGSPDLQANDRSDFLRATQYAEIMPLRKIAETRMEQCEVADNCVQPLLSLISVIGLILPNIHIAERILHSNPVFCLPSLLVSQDSAASILRLLIDGIGQ
jgi:hypothetical protein